MTHWRSLSDHDWLIAADLRGKECTVTIEKVVGGTVTGEGGKKTRKPVLYFKGKKLPLALNKTNGKTIAAMYGNEVENWVGRQVTLYPTTTEKGGETVDCIRLRPGVPRGKQDSAPDEEPSDPPPPDEGVE